MAAAHAAQRAIRSNNRGLRWYGIIGGMNSSIEISPKLSEYVIVQSRKTETSGVGGRRTLMLF